MINIWILEIHLGQLKINVRDLFWSMATFDTFTCYKIDVLQPMATTFERSQMVIQGIIQQRVN